MNMNSLVYHKLNDLFYNWMSINDLDEFALMDPVRSAHFAAYAMDNARNLVDCWDIRNFVEMINNDVRGAEKQTNKQYD